MLLYCEVHNSYVSASKNNQKCLNNDSNYDNKPKQKVIADSCKDIDLWAFEFPGVQFIEDLHPNKDLKKDSKMSKLFRVVWWEIEAALDIQ